ncbi:hypothetical protein LTR28_000420, partial [Elasticomyces elasticus]
MAAPQGTSINAVTATPDMKWVFSGGSDGYIRMYNWVDTVNGKVPLTVAQKHPFVDSVMKAGSLLTYWENEEAGVRTPPSQTSEETKYTSPVYSLAVEHQATWLLSGLESGGINLQTCRHQAGTRICTLREHTSAVSVLSLAQDERSVLSGSWDKNIYDWDLDTGQVKRAHKGSGGQISAIEQRPISSLPVPALSEATIITNGTFSSNNATKPSTNGVMPNGVKAPVRRASKDTSANGLEDGAGSPDGSLFGDGGNDDDGSLFGDSGGGGINFGDDENTNEFSSAMANGPESQENVIPDGFPDAEMPDAGSGGPVQPPEELRPPLTPTAGPENGYSNGEPAQSTAETHLVNGLPYSEELATPLPNGAS